MDEWAADAVRLVLGLTPGSVLEVGAGTGILALPIGSAVGRYAGCDVAPAAVDLLRALPLPPGRAEFEVRPAHDLGGFGRYDVVLFHSVVHHFPGEAYLRRAVAEAVGHLTPGGRVVIGDLLAHGLRRAYLLDGLAARGTGPAEPAAVLAALDRRAATDVELSVSPAALAALAAEHGLVADVRLKPGRLPNEFNVYRLNAVLRPPSEALADPGALPRHPWEIAPPAPDWAALAPFVLTGIPHPLQQRTVRALAALEAAAGGGPVDLAALLDGCEQGTPPADVLDAAAARGLSAAALPAARPGWYDVVVTAAPAGVRYRPAPGEERGIARPEDALARRAAAATRPR